MYNKLNNNTTGFKGLQALNNMVRWRWSNIQGVCLESLRNFLPGLITHERYFNAALPKVFIFVHVIFPINFSCPSGQIISVEVHWSRTVMILFPRTWHFYHFLFRGFSLIFSIISLFYICESVWQNREGNVHLALFSTALSSCFYTNIKLA